MAALILFSLLCFRKLCLIVGVHLMLLFGKTYKTLFANSSK